MPSLTSPAEVDQDEGTGSGPRRSAGRSASRSVWPVIGALAALLVLTVLLIAHRLVTVRHADRIYVLAEGRVSESGPYAELISANGTFAHLARSAVGRS